MKKLSDYTNRPAPVLESTGIIRQNGSEIINGTSILADELNASANMTNPNIVVSDNKKMKKMAELVISMLNKNCGWKAYYHTYFKVIDGISTILILSGIRKGLAVTVTPIGIGDNSVIRYYLNYDLESDHQTADYTISAKNMGLVKMLGLLFDIIKNPSAYKGGMYEGRNAGNDYAALNEGVTSHDDILRTYDMVEATERYRVIKNFIFDDENKMKHNVGKNLSREGIFKFADELKKLNSNFSPIQIVFDLRNNTANGQRYREILSNGSGSTSTASVETYCAIVKIICTSERFGIDVKVTTNEGVTVKTPAPMSEKLIYRGLDVTVAQYVYGGNMEKFYELCDKYFDDMDYLKRNIRRMVEYCKSSKSEKLKNNKIGAPCIFISGKGGVGKSEAWKDVRSEMRLKDNIDYAQRGTSTCNASQLYDFVYDNNGKLLVFDDTPNLFDTGFQRAFWKHVLEVDAGVFPQIEAPRGTATGEGPRGNYYGITDCTVGDIVNYRKMYEKECPETANRKAIAKAKKQEEKEDEIEKLKTQVRYLPDKMRVMSRFLIITNETPEALAKIMGKNSWDAVEGRSLFFEFAPPSLVLWAKIKEKLLQVKAENDETWDVPPQYVDEVIEFVENEIKKNGDCKISWRTFTNGVLKSDFIYGEDWRKSLRRKMETK